MRFKVASGGIPGGGVARCPRFEGGLRPRHEVGREILGETAIQASPLARTRL